MLQQFVQGIAPRSAGSRGGAAAGGPPAPVTVPAWITEFMAYKLVRILCTGWSHRRNVCISTVTRCGER